MMREAVEVSCCRETLCCQDQPLLPAAAAGMLPDVAALTTSRGPVACFLSWTGLHLLPLQAKCKQPAGTVTYQDDLAEVEGAGPERVLDMFTAVRHKQLDCHLCM
jgi:hypothetical protein